MFRSHNSLTPFKPADGIQVLARGKLSLYEGRGDYQLIVESLELSGEGLLKQQFEKLKHQLQTAGWFAAEHKKPLPKLPNCLGVITSPTAAALRDILKSLKQRFPALPIILYPTAVQGKQAASSIAKAIQLANRHAACDVLIVARGGGSLEDLWAFNEIEVATAIYESTIPIITGIGHETDITIADFVADHRAPTPSLAAIAAVMDYRDLLQQFQHQFKRLQQHWQRQMQWWRKHITHLQKRLQSPQQHLQQLAQQCDHFEIRLLTAMNHLIARKKQHLLGLARTLHSLSPLATLDRGYCVLRDGEQVISSITHCTVGQTVVAQLKDGKVTAVVSEINGEY